MAHELTETNGRYEMAYIGREPWHGLGQRLAAGASHEEWLQAAGMAWRIESSMVRFKPFGEAMTRSFSGQRVLYRSDTQAPLSVVSNDYQVVQPSQVLEYFDVLVQNAGFQLDTAGTMFGGRRFWALATVGEESPVKGTDKVLGRLLLCTSADKSMATTAKFLMERVVCHNTLTAGLREVSETTVKMGHRRAFDPEKLNADLGIQIQEQFHSTMEQFRRLAETPMYVPQAIAATAELRFPGIFNQPIEDVMAVLKQPTTRRIAELAVVPGAAIGSYLGSADTAWGWLNAVTQFVDHETSARVDDYRLDRAWFGRGDIMKSRAFDMALQVSEGKSWGAGLEGQLVGALLGD